MSEFISEKKSSGSFFNLAAWYCLVAPIVYGPIYVILYFKQPQNSYEILGVVFWILAASLSAGIISLFGIPKLGAKKILWKALIGIVLGAIVEFFVFVAGIGYALGATPKADLILRFCFGCFLHPNGMKSISPGLAQRAYQRNLIRSG